MPGTLKKILEQANAAITQGDYEKFLSFCTDDTEWAFIGDRTLRGKIAVRSYMADAYKEPPKFIVRHFIEEGDYLTAIGEITMKDDEGMFTSYHYCDVWRFKGGKMAALQAFVIKFTQQ